MFDLVYWLPVIVGGTVAGASSGLLGVFIVGMRISFLGVCMAHLLPLPSGASGRFNRI